jgi:hypothetical protein
MLCEGKAPVSAVRDEFATSVKIAFTWQRSLEKPAEVAVRETLLITCDPDGSHRKKVASREYEVPENSSGRDGITIYFQVWSWWKAPK